MTGVSHIHKVHLIHTLCCDTSSRALIVVSDEGEAERLREDLTLLGDKALVFPVRDLTLRAVESLSREYEHVRLGVLAQMLEGDYNQVICCVDALSQISTCRPTSFCAILSGSRLGRRSPLPPCAPG